jgi:hypothetical protein
VAGNLEADWNTRLRELAQARDDYARARDTDAALDAQQQARVLALAGDFPALWNDPATPMRERKRLLRAGALAGADLGAVLVVGDVAPSAAGPRLTSGRAGWGERPGPGRHGRPARADAPQPLRGGPKIPTNGAGRSP